MSQINALTFTAKQNPEILGVANELAKLERRFPHDSIRLLVLEEGRAKIARLKSQISKSEQESQEKNGPGNSEVDGVTG